MNASMLMDDEGIRTGRVGPESGDGSMTRSSSTIRGSPFVGPSTSALSALSMADARFTKSSCSYRLAFAGSAPLSIRCATGTVAMRHLVALGTRFGTERSRVRIPPSRPLTKAGRLSVRNTSIDSTSRRSRRAGPPRPPSKSAPRRRRASSGCTPDALLLLHDPESLARTSDRLGAEYARVPQHDGLERPCSFCTAVPTKRPSRAAASSSTTRPARRTRR
jgi:hypothetical protein